MIRRDYLKQHGKLTQQLKRAGLPYPRKIFWQMDKRSADRYGTQIKTMKATVTQVTKG